MPSEKQRVDRTAPASPVAGLGGSLGAAGLLALAVAAAAAVYLPVRRTYFFADDFVCMFEIANKGFARFVVQPFGGHLLVLRNAVFYLSYRLFGFEPRPYYWSVLLTHFVNVWLFFRVTRRLTGSAPVACLGAALWGSSPLCAGALTWYAVYGQVLVATIVLLLLDRVGVQGERDERVPWRTAFAWYALLLVGTTCFGIGIGVALAFPAVLFLLLPAAFRQRGVRVAFLSLLVVVPALYFGYWRLYAALNPLPFSEVILQSVALSSYLPIATMLWHLIAFAITSLLGGFAFVATDYPDRASHVAVGLYLGALLAVILAADGATRRHVAALAVLCLGAYGLVAMGRSNLYLMFQLPTWQAARQARYHYAGTIPLAMLTCIIVAQAARWSRRPTLVHGAVLIVWLALGTRAFLRSGWTIDDRIAIRQYAATSVRRIWAAVRATPAGREVYIENEPSPGYVLGPMLHHPEFPGLAGVFVLAFPSNVVDGHAVHFIEHQADVLAMSRDPARNLRLSGLLVEPEAAPAAATTTR